jgi:hypothetical protein
MTHKPVTLSKQARLLAATIPVVITALALLRENAQAGDNIWTEIGPGGSSLEIGSNSWLVPGYRSTDSGKTWQRLGQVSQGPFYGPESVGSAGRDGKILLVLLLPSLQTGGPGGHYMAPPSIFRSTDGGATWGASSWFVTNGLLTVEMVAGRVQTGITTFEERSPSQLPVAGNPDRSFNPIAPGYASFRGVASYKDRDNTVPSRVGSVISQSLDAADKVGSSVPPT